MCGHSPAWEKGRYSPLDSKMPTEMPPTRISIWGISQSEWDNFNRNIRIFSHCVENCEIPVMVMGKGRSGNFPKKFLISLKWRRIGGG
jgi:hypothetical protein